MESAAQRNADQARPTDFGWRHCNVCNQQSVTLAEEDARPPVAGSAAWSRRGTVARRLRNGATVGIDAHRRAAYTGPMNQRSHRRARSSCAPASI